MKETKPLHRHHTTIMTPFKRATVTSHTRLGLHKKTLNKPPLIPAGVWRDIWAEENYFTHYITL